MRQSKSKKKNKNKWRNAISAQVFMYQILENNMIGKFQTGQEKLSIKLRKNSLLKKHGKLFNFC